ncbi:MAG: DUF1073 domain-containing protein, partial [Mycoplasma sp.]|nr:DUF1073 domain-containing protein [Mycoplasma sp.]
VLRILPKRPPSMLLELLQGWGLSEIEKSKKSLNAYFKACETSYSLMDESKVDVYKIDSLADSNLSWSGRESIKSRMKLQHQTKNVLTAIVLDKEDDYEQKHISFTGIAEMLQQYRINVSADSGIPVQKQWGLESMPFTSGEVSLDDYYNLVISNIRPKATEMLKKIITLYMIKYIGVPLKFKIEYHPLKSQTAMEEETIKQSKQNRFISAYANNAITYEQFIGLMNEAGLNKG